MSFWTKISQTKENLNKLESNNKDNLNIPDSVQKTFHDDMDMTNTTNKLTVGPFYN